MQPRALLAFAVLAFASIATGQTTVTEGDVPTHTFANPILNGPGITSLADFQGKPTVVEFWGTR